MGAFLAMKNIVGLLLLGVFLTACGSKNGPPSPIADSLKKQAEAMLQQRAAKRAGVPVPKPSKISRDRIAQIEKPIAQIKVARAGLDVLATQVASNNGYVNFYTKSKTSFVFRNGHLTATRGLPFDLMARDIGSGKRSYKYLSAENQIEALSMNCTISNTKRETVVIFERSYSLLLAEEICKSKSRAIKNRIWRDEGGKAWKAEQWIGPEMGFAVVEWLN